MDVNVKANPKAVAVIREKSGQDACHKVGCRDLLKDKVWSDVYYEEIDLATAEKNYNDDLSEENGYDEPWIWSRDVKVYPCAIDANK